MNLSAGNRLGPLSVAGERTPRPFGQSGFKKRRPRFAPNGRWLAYESDEGGQVDVYVQPFPGPGRKTNISRSGGTQPVWSRDGRELYYLRGDDLIAVSVSVAAGELSPGAPRVLFRKHTTSVDVAADGRFLIIEDPPPQTTAAPIAVVVNWTASLR